MKKMENLREITFKPIEKLDRKSQNGVLGLAALAGFVGLLLIVHYATLGNPMRQLAIVVDAGSTKTRSGLYTVELDRAEIERLNNETSSEETQELGSVLTAKEVASCLNGGPLAAIKSEAEAQQMVSKCLQEFVPKIRELGFEVGTAPKLSDKTRLAQGLLNKVAPGIQLTNEDKKTHVYLGATAGLRSLAAMDATRASEKIQWIDLAIGQSQTDANGPQIDKGQVSMLSGFDEASLAWSSVNLVCDRLLVGKPKKSRKIDSVGILELGGASSQIAYEFSGSAASADPSLEVKQVELFNQTYQVAARSDLCVGMTQGTQRAYFALLQDYFRADNVLSDSEIENPCLQTQARVTFSSQEAVQIAGEACLQVNQQTVPTGMAEFIRNKPLVRFVGTGDVDKCSLLMEKLVDEARCKTYFSLCPGRQIAQQPPAEVNFITISAYNNPLKNLQLEPEDAADGSSKVISEKLGGRSISYQQFTDQRRQFCAIDVNEFPSRYPKLSKEYYPTTCFQLVYVDKMLRNLHSFNTPESWKQIKWLIFEPEQTSRKDDMGWTFGMLLKATSERLSHGFAGNSTAASIFSRLNSLLGSTRSTALLTLGCLLVVISLIVTLVFGAKKLLSDTSATSRQHVSHALSHV